MFVVLIFARELDGGVGIVIGWIGGWFGVLAGFGLRIGVSFGVGGEVSGSRRVLIVAIGIVFSFFVCFFFGWLFGCWGRFVFRCCCFGFVSGCRDRVGRVRIRRFVEEIRDLIGFLGSKPIVAVLPGGPEEFVCGVPGVGVGGGD